MSNQQAYKELSKDNQKLTHSEILEAAELEEKLAKKPR